MTVERVTPERLAAAIQVAMADHERIDHHVAQPVPIPDDCLLDTAYRILGELRRTALVEWADKSQGPRPS